MKLHHARDVWIDLYFEAIDFSKCFKRLSLIDKISRKKNMWIDAIIEFVSNNFQIETIYQKIKNSNKVIVTNWFIHHVICATWVHSNNQFRILSNWLIIFQHTLFSIHTCSIKIYFHWIIFNFKICFKNILPAATFK